MLCYVRWIQHGDMWHWSPTEKRVLWKARVDGMEHRGATVNVKLSKWASSWVHQQQLCGTESLLDLSVYYTACYTVTRYTQKWSAVISLCKMVKLESLQLFLLLLEALDHVLSLYRLMFYLYFSFNWYGPANVSGIKFLNYVLLLLLLKMYQTGAEWPLIKMLNVWVDITKYRCYYSTMIQLNN